MKSFVIVFAVAAATASANAAVISSWNTAGLAGSEATLVGTGSPSVTAANANRGAGLTGNAGGNSLNAAGWDDLGANDYFSFGFTVASGSSVDLNLLQIGTRSSGSGPGTVGIYYSGNGFSTALATINQAPGANFVNSAIALSLTGLTGNVEFRVRAVGTVSAAAGTVGATGTFRITNYFASGTDTGSFNLNGTTSAIPTPGAMGLMGLGGLLAARRRR